MNKTYSLFIFDFDGTIADTKASIVSSFQRSLTLHNLSPINDNEIIETIGEPLIEMYRLLIPQDSGINHDLLVTTFRKIYAQESSKTITAFKGMKELLEQLYTKGLKTTIASNKKSDLIRKNSNTLNILKYFSLIIGVDDVINPKPDPEMVNITLNRLEIVKRESVLVIGDSSFDIEMGKAAHVDTCAVTWGAHIKSQLLTSNPTYLIENVSDLHTFIPR